MSSEKEHGITEQPAPTCPMIDKILRKLERVEQAMRNFDRFDDPEQLKTILCTVEDELFNWNSSVYDNLDEIRTHVENTREWGEEWKQYALKLKALENEA